MIGFTIKALKPILICFLISSPCVVLLSQANNNELRHVTPPKTLLHHFFLNQWNFKNHQSKSLFCLIEDQLNKNNRLPIKFRLGSREYTDFLESKSMRNEKSSLNLFLH